jgi:hypothetical protein
LDRVELLYQAVPPQAQFGDGPDLLNSLLVRRRQAPFPLSLNHLLLDLGELAL